MATFWALRKLESNVKLLEGPAVNEGVEASILDIFVKKSQFQNLQDILDRIDSLLIEKGRLLWFE